MPAQALVRETDLSTCHSALSQLNSFLDKDAAVHLPPLDAKARGELQQFFGLDEGELSELETAKFSRLDGHHLELCLLLRDAATLLRVEAPATPAGPEGQVDVAKRPDPLHQAAAAFAWTVRQVRLEPSRDPPLPPEFVLRRGSGTALERALVFLSLLSHILDPESESAEGGDEKKSASNSRMTGCLVYCPNKDGKDRLWACGVAIQGKTDLYLFDPRLGLPLPGPKGEGIATLAEARTNGDVLGQLTVSDQHRYDVTPEQATKADVRYYCPLSSLAPRMRLLQDELLAPVVKVRLAVDFAADRERLEKAAKAQLGDEAVVRAWKDGDRSGPGVERRFLPPVEGGVDADKNSRAVRFLFNLVTPTMPSIFYDQRRFPPNSGMGQRVHGRYPEPFLRVLMAGDGAREELLRGNMDPAVQQLMQIREVCDVQENELRQENGPDLVREVERWVDDDAIPLFAEQEHARQAGDTQALEDVNRRIDAMWNEGTALRKLLLGTRAVVLRLEVVFQLGLCKQEQAERLQAQADLTPDDRELAEHAVSAWKEAANVWEQYQGAVAVARGYWLHDFIGARLWDQYVDLIRYSSRNGAAVRLLGRAQFLSGNREAAKQTWRDIEQPMTPLEKVALLYLARNAEKERRP